MGKPWLKGPLSVFLAFLWWCTYGKKQKSTLSPIENILLSLGHYYDHMYGGGGAGFFKWPIVAQMPATLHVLTDLRPKVCPTTSEIRTYFFISRQSTVKGTHIKLIAKAK